MRINQFVAGASGLSRRAADAAITTGRVQLNGLTATLGQSVETTDALTLDGAPLHQPATHSYVLLHKPAGYVSSRARQSAAPTLYGLLPAQWHRLKIAGRLDLESSGLIVLSDDGKFIQTLTHPTAGKIKRYELTLESPLSPAHRAQLEAGIPLRDGLSRVKVLTATGRRLTVTLSEGRNRQLRRTLGALGYTVLRLHRTQIGDIKLGDLPSGCWVETDQTGHSL